MMTGVNRAHRNQRNQFHDDEEEDGYEDTPSNATETALLNAIQDLPRKLQKTNTKLLQTHVPSFRGSKDKYNEFQHLLLNQFANKIREPSPTRSQKKIKFISFRVYFDMKLSTFGKLSPSIQPPHCKTSCNYLERNLQRKI